jgi:hypothetical protein
MTKSGKQLQKEGKFVGAKKAAPAAKSADATASKKKKKK